MGSYEFDPAHSRLVIRARSSVHPINTEADGVAGRLDLHVRDDVAEHRERGVIDLDAPVAATLQFELQRLSSGNPLYDIETERRIEVKRYPLVEATVSGLQHLGAHSPDAGDADGDQGGDGSRYDVTGDLTLHGVTQSLTGEIGVRVVDDDTLQLWGEQVIDVRAWRIHPPRIGLLKVHPDVLVRIEVVARRAR